MGTNERPAYSGLVTRRFKLPKGCSCREFLMRELTGADDLVAAQRADAHLSQDEKMNPVVSMTAQRQEGMRLSLVQVDGETVNLGAPFVGMDSWSQRTMVFVSRAFNSLNGVEEEEVKNFLAGAADELTAPAAPPRAATPASDDPEDD